ncbi:HK97 family phage prohead protease [Nonomuraea sp. K274]|uniref:HK97 family phage prohead protease n=1 Tax=Nonomuraea cypriaca TaxID=1187855 RepID=A0A931ACM1_9ACTN|nr:HK97 family phage prohead protease [Nonomuraea cypriaca]MBF8189120.1 HK97 family phage prohead protease [Nonomuraea cypriaca]
MSDSADIVYRSYVPDLEVRSAAKGGDGRTVVGLAVPYNSPQRIDARLTEQFARSAFNRQLEAAHRIPLTREHMAHGGTLIGKTILLRDDSAGLYGEWRISRTAVGDETLELIKDGVLSHLSVGFRSKQDRRLQDGTIERVTAELREVSVVLEGAYGDHAAVAEVRSIEEGLTRLEEARQIFANLPILPS